ncbi:MAG: hypothetical protein MUF41_07425, partial [Sphingopyxis sp.]|nr:hypothetical protein [Sphingopyxis sp.]
MRFRRRLARPAATARCRFHRICSGLRGFNGARAVCISRLRLTAAQPQPPAPRRGCISRRAHGRRQRLQQRFAIVARRGCCHIIIAAIRIRAAAFGAAFPPVALPIAAATVTPIGIAHVVARRLLAPIRLTLFRTCVWPGFKPRLWPIVSARRPPPAIDTAIPVVAPVAAPFATAFLPAVVASAFRIIVVVAAIGIVAVDIAVQIVAIILVTATAAFAL